MDMHTVNGALAIDCLTTYQALSDVAVRLGARGLPVDNHEAALDDLTTAIAGLLGPTRAIELAAQRGLDWRPIFFKGDD